MSVILGYLANSFISKVPQDVTAANSSDLQMNNITSVQTGINSDAYFFAGGNTYRNPTIVVDLDVPPFVNSYKPGGTARCYDLDLPSSFQMKCTDVYTGNQCSSAKMGMVMGSGHGFVSPKVKNNNKQPNILEGNPPSISWIHLWLVHPARTLL